MSQNPSQSATTISRTLADFASGLRLEDVPAPVIERAKHHILDSIGVALASSTEDFAHRALSAISSIGGDGGKYPVIGFACRLQMRDAVLANGALVHGIDFDDTHAAGVLHASASALPMALAAAQSVGGGGREVLLAYLIAVETASRVATAAKSGFHQNGFHPTGMVAPFGAVLGIGRLWGLTPAQMAHAQGLVLSMASGSFEFLEDGAWNKRLHPGWAVGGAITACAMAKNGFIGATRAYEGRYGLFNAFLGEKDAADLGACTAGLGSQWEMLKVSLKPYPVCHYNHSFLDAALALRKAHDLRPEDIESVNAFISKDQIDIVCEPQANKRRPQNTYDARFSLPFALSAALVRGRLTMDEISDEMVGHPQVLALAERTRYTIDPKSAFPRHYSGRLEITLKDGRTLSHTEAINRGHPDHPLAREDIVGKFRSTASRALPADRVQAIVDDTLALERATSAQAFASSLATTRPN